MRTSKTQTRYGTMMVPALDNLIGKSLCEYGEWTQSELDLLLQLVQPGMVVLDLGANVGYHTLALARAVGPHGAVVAFEPQPGIFQLLAANVAINDLENVTLLNVALGEQAGFVDMPPFAYTDSQNFGALDLHPLLKTSSDSASHLPVPLMRLDDIPQARNAALIKMDVESMELEVLKGATQLLAARRPALFLENDVPGPLSQSLISHLHAIGYDAYWQVADVFNPANFRMSETNIFGPMCCVNILALPREAKSDIRGLPRVCDAREYPVMRAS